jgi:hypothetical protein
METNSSLWCDVVLLVSHVLHPGNMGSVQRFLHGEMNHAGVGRGPVPVFLAGRDPDSVSRADLSDGSAPGLDTADPGEDMQGLSQGVGVPSCASAWLEADTCGADSGWSRGVDDRVVPDRACKGIRGSTLGRDRIRSSDFHVGLPVHIQPLNSLIVPSRVRGAGICSASHEETMQGMGALRKAPGPYSCSS